MRWRSETRWLRGPAAFALGVLAFALGAVCLAPKPAPAQQTREELAAKLPASNLSGDAMHQDVATLLAYEKGASLLVSVGAHFNLVDFLDRNRAGMSSTFLTRLRVGDTLTSRRRPAGQPLPGYQDVKPMVFAGIFPTDSDDYPELRDALERLRLNDGSLSYEPETSQALGFGFRCGFLGLLHMEIVRERLEREFDLDLLITAPNVAFWSGSSSNVRSACPATRSTFAARLTFANAYPRSSSARLMSASAVSNSSSSKSEPSRRCRRAARSTARTTSGGSPWIPRSSRRRTCTGGPSSTTIVIRTCPGFSSSTPVWRASPFPATATSRR